MTEGILRKVSMNIMLALTLYLLHWVGRVAKVQNAMCVWVWVGGCLSVPPQDRWSPNLPFMNTLTNTLTRYT